MKSPVRLITTFCITIFLSLSTASVQGAFDAGDYRKFVNGEMKTWNVPGAAILIIQDGKVVFSEGFGHKDMKNRLTVTPKTLFGIGSCSKAFTSLSIGMLVDEKKMDFDKPAREYYPAFKLYDSYATERVTVKDILSHRTGIPRYDAAIDTKDSTREVAINKLKYLKPNTGIRERFQYNNFHYAVAGIMVDTVSGMPWEEFVSKRIFKPLGMDSSNLSPEDSKKFPDFAIPHKMDNEALKKFPANQAELFSAPIKELPFENIGVYGPAGSINSNLEDMAKWVLFHLNGGKIGDGQLISQDTLSQLFTPQMLTGSPMKYDEILPGSYGMAWMITPYRGHYLVSHDGMIEGFTAHVGFLPAEKAGLVILTNRSNNYEFMASASFNTYDRILGLTEVPWSTRLSNAISRELAGLKEKVTEEERGRKKGTKPSHSLTDYAGEYEHPAFGTVTIDIKDNGLKLSLRDIEEATAPLRHYQYDTFKTVNKGPVGGLDLRVTFLMGKNGDIDRASIPLEPSAEEIVFRKILR
ncbi:MAG: serine hydrolase [Proteobacteria bacterium]|nr:serine hydrolase [Pseudomonadota bacterium]